MHSLTRRFKFAQTRSLKSLKLNSRLFSTSAVETLDGDSTSDKIPLPSVWTKPDRCVSILGAPVSFGQPFTGAHHAPDEIRSLGLHRLLSDLSWRVNELGNSEVADFLRTRSGDREVPGAKNCFSVGAASEHIYEDITSAFKSHPDDFMLILGGDHSIPLGTLPAVLEQRPNTGIIWVDAHADINTPLISGSGNLHGQPVGLMMRGAYESTDTLPGFEWMKNHFSKGKNGETGLFDPEDIVYVGLRDVDQGERALLKKLNVKCYTMYDIDSMGIGKVMSEVLSHFETLGKEHYHLSYDIDALDPFIAPSTGTTVRGGLTFREAHYVVESLARTQRLSSMDLVEVNPKLLPGDKAEMTTQMAMQLISSAVGQKIM